MVGMITRPTPEYILKRLPDYHASPRYADADRAVALVFDSWSSNTCIEAVLAKVVILNSLYSTNIYGVYPVAQHIIKLNVDSRLAAGDIQLVDDMAKVLISGQQRNNLSFASKYCHWHHPDAYQIFDSFVEKLLWAYQREYQYSRFKRVELRQYPRFMQVVDDFIEHFALNDISRKDLDKYLWMEGRSLFGGQTEALA